MLVILSLKIYLYMFASNFEILALWRSILISEAFNFYCNLKFFFIILNCKFVMNLSLIPIFTI